MAVQPPHQIHPICHEFLFRRISYLSLTPALPQHLPNTNPHHLLPGSTLMSLYPGFSLALLAHFPDGFFRIAISYIKKI